MKVFSGSFEFSTEGEFDFIDHSSEVDRVIRESGIKEGVTLVFAGHATGVIIITEYESRLRKDIKEFLERFIPSEANYHHASNAFAHLRSMFLTPSKVVPVHNGRLFLGTWQSIFWLEAENTPRRRRITVYVVGE